MDGQNDDDDDDIVEDIPDTKVFDNGDVDTADAKESKLVQDILGRQAEQEASAKPDAEEGKDNAAGKSSTGIKLGRLRKTGVEKKAAAGASSTSAAGSGDIERLRKAVQVLVQHTGPLGTCMDYIQEDISLMTAELHRWEEECQKYVLRILIVYFKLILCMHYINVANHGHICSVRYEVEMEQQKQKTQDALKPLYSELNELEEQVLCV